MSKKYYVDGIVCDYGVFYPNEPENELICVCNLKSNAELIAAILNADNEEVSTCWRDKKLDELFQQLAEKDRIIKEREEALDRKTKKNLQDYFAEKKRFYYLACADIRKKLVKYNHINWTIIQDILNQIEKGE